MSKLDMPVTVECQMCGTVAETTAGFAEKGEIDVIVPLGWQRKVVRNRQHTPPLYDHVFSCPEHGTFFQSKTA